MDGLLPLADYVFTNSRYPMIFSPGSESLLHGMAALLEQGRARLVVTTLGEEGSVLMRREEGPVSDHPDITVESFTGGGEGGGYQVVRCAARRPPGPVEDTTGAGDGYIGAMVYGLVVGMDAGRAMVLASYVAAHKCTALGARCAPAAPPLPARRPLTWGGGQVRAAAQAPDRRWVVVGAYMSALSTARRASAWVPATVPRSPGGPDGGIRVPQGRLIAVLRTDTRGLPRERESTDPTS